MAIDKASVKKREKRLDSGAALMVIAIAATQADGALHLQELAHLRMILCQNPLYKDIDHADRYIERWARFLKQTGAMEALRRAIDALSPRLRETAYAWAVEIVYSDYKQKQTEHAFLKSLRTQLGINAHLAQKIQVVTAIRLRAS